MMEQTKWVALPRGLRFDVFALPKDFDDQIRAAFAAYTEGTSPAYTYQAHYTGNHRIDDKIMEMIARVIKVVINFGEE